MSVDRDDLTITEDHLDAVYVRDITTPELRVTFIRLERGTIPVTTLRGEAHVDVGPDGQILGVTIEVMNHGS